MDKKVIININKCKVLFLREECANGDGAFIYPNRSKYEGHWKDGQRDEWGVLTSPDGSKENMSQAFWLSPISFFD